MPIGINTSIALELHKDHLRRARKDLLEKKDIEFIRAIEVNDTESITRISAEKQALRDITDIVKDFTFTSNDPVGVTSELKQVWDESVIGPNILVNPPERTM